MLCFCKLAFQPLHTYVVLILCKSELLSPLPFCLALPPHSDMRDLSVYRDGGSYYNRYFSSLQDLRVPLGDNVEVECSTSASETPEYSWKKEVSRWTGGSLLDYVVVLTWHQANIQWLKIIFSLKPISPPYQTLTSCSAMILCVCVLRTDKF